SEDNIIALQFGQTTSTSSSYNSSSSISTKSLQFGHSISIKLRSSQSSSSSSSSYISSSISDKSSSIDSTYSAKSHCSSSNSTIDSAKLSNTSIILCIILPSLLSFPISNPSANPFKYATSSYKYFICTPLFLFYIN